MDIAWTNLVQLDNLRYSEQLVVQMLKLNGHNVYLEPKKMQLDYPGKGEEKTWKRQVPRFCVCNSGMLNPQTLNIQSEPRKGKVTMTPTRPQSSGGVI